MSFGRSLSVDLYDVDSELCNDLSYCYQVLTDLVDFLGMHAQSPPFIFRSPHHEYPDKKGLSGWIPLIESGIQIHTMTLQKFISLDIYTCGELNTERVVSFIEDRFAGKNYEVHYLERGINFK